MGVGFKPRFSGTIGQRDVSGKELMLWQQRLLAHAVRERRRIAICLAVGMAMQLMVIGSFAGGFVLFANRAQMSRRESLLAGSAVGSVLCVVMLGTAALTKPEDREDLAKLMLDEGFRAACRQDAITGPPIVIAVIVALYGGYAMVEAAKRARVRLRLRSACRFESARIMAHLDGSPAGITTGLLLKHGQSMDSLRQPVALLLLDGWIDLRDEGRSVVMRGAAMRALTNRHPLKDVFNVAG